MGVIEFARRLKSFMVGPQPDLVDVALFHLELKKSGVETY